MKVAYKLLLGLTLLQGVAYAADEPKIEVVDGKISMSAQAVSLGRLMGMFDKAMGLKSDVKPEFANQNISVQFSNLGFNDAVKKIFQGQPFNYIVIEGKGIKVTDRSTGGTTTGGSSSSFDSQPFNSPVQSFNSPPPIQQQPNNPAAANIFGAPAPAPNTNTTPSAPLTGPGVMPPAIGAGNPLNNPTGGNNTGAIPIGGVPAPAAPAAPGTLGATPGTIR